MIMSEQLDDFVVGAVDPNYDYTKQDVDDTVPFGVDTEITDDDGFDAGDIAPGVMTSDIEKNAFRFLPPGVYPDLQVKSVEWADKGTPINIKVYVKGENGIVRPDFFVSRRCKVTFCVPGDPNNTTNDMFQIPPAKSQYEAWRYGFAASSPNAEENANKKPRESGGFHDKKLKQFLGRLGFQEDPKTGQLPPEAGKFLNWLFYPGTKIPRRIGLEIQRGRQQPDKIVTDPKTKQQAKITPTVYNQVKMYSYTYCDPPADAAIAMKHQALSAQQGRQAANQPAVAEPEKASEDPPATKPENKKGRKTAASNL
jgi:hypothetical protein